MTWNYRIVRYADGKGYGLHEVYYNRAGEPVSMTESCATFGCDADDGPHEIIKGLQIALNDAKSRPVLDEPAQWATWDDENF